MRQKNLLTPIQSSTLSILDMKTEKKKAFSSVYAPDWAFGLRKLGKLVFFIRRKS
jgi:hypothetical protein